MAVGLLALSLSLYADYGGPLPVLALNLGLCLAAAATAFRLRIGSLLVLLGIAVMSQLPATEVGAGYHACLVPVYAAMARGRRRLALALSVVFLALNVEMTARQHHSLHVSIPYLLTWAFLFGLAAALGGALGFVQQRGARREQAALDEQRRVLAMHLHDTVAHELTLIAMQAHSAQLRDGENEDLQRIAEGARRSVSQVRELMELTRGASPDRIEGPRNLKQVIASQQQTLRTAGFTVTHVHDGDTPLPPAVSTCLALVAHEALNNVLRHGDPSGPCLVTTRATPESAQLLVCNETRGDDEALDHQPWGLDGMRATAEQLGGRLEVSRHDGQFVVDATIPLVRGRRGLLAAARGHR